MTIYDRVDRFSTSSLLTASFGLRLVASPRYSLSASFLSTASISTLHTPSVYYRSFKLPRRHSDRVGRFLSLSPSYLDLRLVAPPRYSLSASPLSAASFSILHTLSVYYRLFKLSRRHSDPADRFLCPSPTYLDLRVITSLAFTLSASFLSTASFSILRLPPVCYRLFELRRLHSDQAYRFLSPSPNYLDLRPFRQSFVDNLL